MNPRGRPAASGFGVAYLEAGVAEAALYGCRFDANGNVTAWVEAAMDSAGDTFVVAATE